MVCQSLRSLEQVVPEVIEIVGQNIEEICEWLNLVEEFTWPDPLTFEIVVRWVWKAASGTTRKDRGAWSTGVSGTWFKAAREIWHPRAARVEPGRASLYVQRVSCGTRWVGWWQGSQLTGWCIVITATLLTLAPYNTRSRQGSTCQGWARAGGWKVGAWSWGHGACPGDEARAALRRGLRYCLRALVWSTIHTYASRSIGSSWRWIWVDCDAGCWQRTWAWSGCEIPEVRAAFACWGETFQITSSKTWTRSRWGR